MISKEILIRFEEFADASALPPADLQLLTDARQAAGSAYAPYSGFYVGAAVRLASGAIVTGSNQENVAYPSGLCAERVAMFHASHASPDDPLEAVAITGRARAFAVNSPVMPCGACRQVLAEYEMKSGRPVRMILQGDQGPVYVVEGIANLLPLMFRAEGLKKS
jgi:cytidine deaminase